MYECIYVTLNYRVKRKERKCMSKQEMRKEMMEEKGIIGDAQQEMEEMRKMQQNTPEDVVSLSVGCNGFLTLMCCP